MAINDSEHTSGDNTHDPCLCETKHPLERDGTGQGQRLLPALDPAYVKPDERSIEDMLLFARSFSEKLRFFDTENEPDGSWLNFIENDVTMLVAVISKINLFEERKELQARIETMEQLLAADDNADIELVLPEDIIKHIAGLIKTISDWYIRSDSSLRLYHDLNLTFTSVFVPNIRRIAGVLKAAETKLSFPINFTFADFEEQLNDEWIAYLKKPEIFGETGSGEIDWENDVTIPPLDTVFQVDGNEKQAVRSASRYLHGLYEQQANALQTFAVKKNFYLTETLENYPYHKAHIGLFLAFLRVFTYAQEHLNGLTARHLDYYYESVLGLKRKAASPDKVHVIFELAKNVTEFLVAENTELNASKDKKSIQVVFNTCDDLLVNTSKATTFKNLLVETDLTGAGVDRDFYGIYASPVANSSDGIGGELDKDVPQWEGFGDSQYGLIDQIRTMPDARVGFAIASPQLVLNEGSREIKLTFQMESGQEKTQEILDAIFEHPGDAIICRLTGKKGWFTPTRNVEVSIVTKETIDDDQSWIYNYGNIGIGGSYYENAGIFNPKPGVFGNYFPLLGETAATDSGSGSRPGFSFFYELTLTIRLDATEQAILPYSAAAHLGSYVTPYPIIGIEFPNYPAQELPEDPEAEDYLEAAKHKRNVYSFLKTVSIRNGKIGVKVSGLKNVIVQNDVAKLKPDAPFLPFGVQPSENSSFYIGSQEIFYKKLNTLDIYLAWHELPADLNAYYLTYKKALLTDDGNGNYPSFNFTVDAEYRDNRQWKKLSTTDNGVGPLSLFQTVETSEDSDINGHVKYSFASTDATSTQYNKISGFARYTGDTKVDEYNNDVQRGFIRMNLNSPDFQHKAYPTVLAAVAFATASSAASILKNQIVNPPYTPTVRSVTVDYSSEQQLEAGIDQLFHLYPFGEAEVLIQKEATFLLPQFRFFELVEDELTGKSVPELSDEEQQSMLFIGLEKAKPGTSISMLVQMVENSGSPNVSPPDINWSYLRNNTWIKLNQQQVISDTTNGFLTSGIVEVALPNDATDTNTVLDSGKYWLAASVATGYNALSSILGIYTQAVCAEFADAGNDPKRLAEPLESGQIAKLLNTLPQVKKVTQPYASFGGRMAEQSPEYYRRVSERLRHKGRSMAIWDYEHLVLEYFPSIYKVKCISHTSNQCGSELVPGSVCVTVISNLRNQNQVDTLKPTTSIAVLEEIKAFLLKRSSRFVNLEVINPLFEEVFVEFDVIFYDEYAADNGYYRNLLEEEIKRYLSPWAFDDGAEIVFGGTIHGASIINFIEEREYVSFIRNFKMYLADGLDNNATDLDDVKASSAKSVLVSAASHKINWIAK